MNTESTHASDAAQPAVLPIDTADRNALSRFVEVMQYARDLVDTVGKKEYFLVYVPEHGEPSCKSYPTFAELCTAINEYIGSDGYMFLFAGSRLLVQPRHNARWTVFDGERIIPIGVAPTMSDLNESGALAVAPPLDTVVAEDADEENDGEDADEEDDGEDDDPDDLLAA